MISSGMGVGRSPAGAADLCPDGSFRFLEARDNKAIAVTVNAIMPSNIHRTSSRDLMASLQTKGGEIETSCISSSSP